MITRDTFGSRNGTLSFKLTKDNTDQNKFEVVGELTLTGVNMPKMGFGTTFKIIREDIYIYTDSRLEKNINKLKRNEIISLIDEIYNLMTDSDNELTFASNDFKIKYY